MRRIEGLEIVKQPKEQCIDFDSDCLLVKDYLTCWVYDRERGHCPFLQNKDYLPYLKELEK